MNPKESALLRVLLWARRNLEVQRELVGLTAEEDTELAVVEDLIRNIKESW